MVRESPEAIKRGTSFFDPATNELHLVRNPKRVEVLEEYGHYLQKFHPDWNASLTRTMDELAQNPTHRVLRDSPFAPQRYEFRRTAEEINIKQFLLDNAQWFGLSKADEIILKGAIKRLRSHGISQGY